MSDQPTSIVPGAGRGFGDSTPPQTTRPERRPLTWNGGADAGLLVLRFAVGGVFFAHGMQKVFGLWGGGDQRGIFRDNLAAFGYTDADTLSWVVGVGELVLGAFVVLGVLVPFAAAGLLAIKINAVLVKAGAGFFVAGAAGADAVELDVVLGLAAAALVLAGPGRITVDHGPWHRRPAWGVLGLVIGIAAAVLVYVLLRG